MKIQEFQKVVLVLAAVSASILEGCEKNETIANPPNNPADSSSVLVPIGVGTQWTFAFTTYFETGEIYSVDTVRYTIQKDTLLYGKKWAFESHWQTPFRNDDEGFWEYWSEPFLVYRYPVAKGTVYYRTGFRVTVVSTDTLVIVPAGQFRCYQYQINWQGLLVNDFIAPRVGFVRIEVGEEYTANHPFLHELYELASVVIK